MGFVKRMPGIYEGKLFRLVGTEASEEEKRKLLSLEEEKYIRLDKVRNKTEKYITR